MPGWTEPDRIGRYERLQRIGRGAMGTVYRAYDPHIDRTIAIKVLHVDDDPGLRERFQQEVRAAGTLSHQHIVAVHDFGNVDGRPYIVMEYVDGRTLSDVLRDGGSLTLADKLRLIQQLCAALDYAHARGVVHRDIKPANLMIDRSGDLKVVDFGIAKLGDMQLTRTGNVLGTLTYMSPEQIEGHSVDRRSDIFSVGVVLYELVSSRPAFHGDTPSTIIRAIIHDQPVALTELVPDLDPELDRIVRRALQKDPAQRYQTLAQMAADLARVRVATDPTIAPVDTTGTLLIDRRDTTAPAAAERPPTPSAPIAETARSSSSRWVAAIAAFALLVAIGAGALLARSILFRQNATGGSTTPSSSALTTQPSGASTAPSTAPPSSAAGTTPKTSVTPTTQTSNVSTGATEKKSAPQKIEKSQATTIEQKVRTPTAYEQAQAILSNNPTPEQKSTAATFLQKACDGNEAAACLQAGLLYRDEPLMKNLPAAAQLFQRACDGKNAEGCNNIAIEYARGTAVPKDEAKAATLFGQACDGGVAPACTSLARAYQNGRGVPQDVARARTLFQKACDSGGTFGCVEGGVLLMRGVGGSADPTTAVAMFRQACDKGSPVGCANLAFAFTRGDGVDKDDVRAAELYQRGCDMGGAPACNSLAGMYTGGRGVTKDLTRAAVLLERSCDGNYADACRALSQRYEQGIGVGRNPTRAAELARRATQLGASQNTSGSGRGSTAPQGTAPPPGIPTGVAGGILGGAAGGAGPPPPPPPRPVRVGGDIKAPAKTKHVSPVYPPIAQSSRVQGVVIIEATIGPDGKVRDARVLRSIPLLDQAAIDAVKQWEFTPTYFKGVAVPVIMTVTVSFTLS